MKMQMKWRFVPMVLALALLIVPQPASAAGPTLSIAMNVLGSQPILAGNPVTWGISWQCSSVDATPCMAARIDVTKPALTTSAGSAAGSPGFTTAAFVDAAGAHYVFIDPLPAGSSGTLQFQYNSVNLHTPDGTLLAPVATFSATNAGSVQASAGATISAATHLAITKRRLMTTEPPLDVDVTYEINVFDASIPNFANALPGTWSVANAVVRDSLPPGAVFVSATGAGSYDAATHSVTWPAIPEVATYEAFCNPNSSCLYVTLRYPSAIFSADNDATNPGDQVTNATIVTSKPFGTPNGADVTAQASVTHGFVAQPVVRGVFGKTVSNSGVRGNGEVGFLLRWQNLSSVPATFTGTDRLPCQAASPAGPLAPCLDPGIRLTRIAARAPVIGGLVSVNYTTNLGNVGTLSFTAPNVFKAPGVGDDIPRTFSPGEFVSHITTAGTLAGGFLQTLELIGIIAPNFPDDPATEADAMTNCAQGSFDFGVFGGPQGPFNSCGTLQVVPAKPALTYFKAGIGLGTIAPTEARTFLLSASNSGQAAWQPVITDLLPANLRYVPNTQTSGLIGGVAPAFVALDNYNGTGRQLLRWSWPGGQALNPRSGISISFQARVEPGTAPGTYTNESQFFDAAFTNNTSLTNICVFAREPDTGDLDGDGNANEFRCRAFVNYTVVQTASMVVTKEVRGSYDGDFMATPAIGLVDPGSLAAYRITLQNTGNLSLRNMVAYDILPFVGDTGVSGPQLGAARESQWQPVLAGPVTPPAGGTVEYSLSNNPCRGEVIEQGGALASGPAGCVNDWTAAPADFAAVRAIRIDMGATMPVGAESRSVIVPISAPLGVQGIAWNTIALASRRADTNDWLLPTELPKVGLVPPPELSISKDDGYTSAASGTLRTYTLTVRNNGHQSASGVAIDDTLPTNTSFVAASDGGSASAGHVTWPAFSLAGEASITRSVTIQVDPLLSLGVNAITNTVSVADDGANGPDPIPANNMASDTDQLAPPPDLAIVKDDGLTIVAPGQVVVYTLVISNTSTQDAASVAVADTLPANTSFVAASDGGSAAAGSVTWPAFSLAAGASATRTVTVRVDETLPAGIVSISNTATVADDGTGGVDPNPANNTASDVDVVSRVPAPSCQVYAVQDVGNSDTQFFTIDIPGNTIQALGPLQARRDIEALALNPVSGILYATGKGHSGKDLLIVDRQSGAVTRVGRIGFGDVDSLAFRPTDATLWGWARGAGVILINPATGAGKLVFHSTKDIQDLAWSGDGGALYAVAEEELYRYDPIRNRLTRVAKNLPGESEALAMPPDGLLAIGVDGSLSMYAYDINSKQVIPSKNVGVQPYDDVEGIAWPTSCGVTP